MTLTLFFLLLTSRFQSLVGSFKCFCNLNLIRFSVTNQLESLFLGYFNLTGTNLHNSVSNHLVRFVIMGGIVTLHAKSSIYAIRFAVDLGIIDLLYDNHLSAKIINNSLTYQLDD